MPRRPILLVVEDDVVLRDLYRVALSLSNFAVHACEDGLDALHYLDQSHPDLIVLDLDLPRVSGLVLYDEMRARRRSDRVPIVVVTGLPTVPDLPDATVLRKPIRPEELIKVIEFALVRRDRTWLFARGNESVLISRIAFPGPNARLHICGPGQAATSFECTDLAACMKRQNEIERALITDGYQLLSRERRTGRDRRTVPRATGSDRRRDLAELDL
jgi:DNA-binding response OmpR family regulator